MLNKLSQNYDVNSLINELEKTKVNPKKLDKILTAGSVKINAFIDDVKKTTLLHKTIKGNNFAASQWLLQNQANPYREDDYNLPAFFYFIHSAIANKLYYLLEENNIDFNYKNSHGRMVLQDIVINGDLPLFNKVLRSVKNPFSLDNYGKNILFDAISSGDKDTMDLVFDLKNVDLSIQDKNKDSLLHIVKDADLNLIEFLLKKGVPPSLQDKEEKNIIFYLSERVEKAKSDVEIKHLTKLIDMALQAKDALDQKDKEGNNLLTSFLSNLNKPLSSYNQKAFLADLISKFIDSGVDIDEKNHEGNNAILISVDKNDVDTVILLIEKCVDINVKNAKDITPLALAVMKGNNEYFEMVRLLLLSNANPNIKDEKGITLVEKIIYILIYINKENNKENDKEETVSSPEESAFDADIEKFNEDDYMRNIFELLISRKMVNFEVLNSQGNPHFYLLIFTQNNYLADLLFKSGASVNQINHNGKNILQYYLDYVDQYEIDETTTVKIIKNIVKFGIDLNFRDEQGATVIHNTLLNKSLSITKNIIGVGGAIDVVDKKGRTLLHNAIWANDIEKVKYVIGMKKDLINLPDKLGIIPINYAAFLGNKELIYYLLSHNSYVNNLHEKSKSTLDFFKRFHKNIYELESEEIDDSEDKRHIMTLLNNMKSEFNIVD